MHMLKVKFIVGMLVIVMLCFSSDAAATNKNISKGETIFYNIKKFKIKVGEAKLVYNGQVQIEQGKALWITFTATGFKFLDEEQIYLDPRSFYPIVITRNLNIFGNKEKIIEFYDQTKGKVRIVKEVDGETTEQIIESDKQFDNIYGFIYRQRHYGHFQSEEGLHLHLPTSDVHFKFIKVKQFSAAGKKFDAYYMRSTPNKYKVFFDSSPNRIPLRIDGALGGGNMSMIMSGRHGGG